MDDKPAPISAVSLIPLRRIKDTAAEIETLRRRAAAEGHGRLAYLLECALVEARHLAKQELSDRAEEDADPGDLWRLRDL